jgi:hypothetical protein
MSYTFDKFMARILREEEQTQSKTDDRLLTERVKEIDPNRQRIMGREHWMNRTRMSWGSK